MAKLVRSFVCDQCSREFVSKSKYNLTVHINNIHGEGFTFVCDPCFKEFSTKSHLVNHIQTQHSHRIRVFKCRLCGIAFRSQQGLQYHHGSIHEGTRFQCDTCGKLFTHKHPLTTHITAGQQQKRPYECNVCEAKFTRRFYLQNHKAAKHHRRPVQCDQCGAEFENKSLLTKHFRSVHMKLRRTYKCVDCQVTFAKRSTRNNHEKTVHKKNIVFTCDVCSKVFAEKSHMMEHIHSVHMKLRAFDCGQCQARYTHFSTLIEHIQRVHKKIVFTCDVCSKSFKNKKELVAHCFAVHMLLFPYKCCMCDRVFRTSSSLYYHRKKIHG